MITVNATLPSGTVGSPYNGTVSASGGTAPYTFLELSAFTRLPPEGCRPAYRSTQPLDSSVAYH